MKAWLGHYRNTKKSWFIVWAPTKDEAVKFVDCEIAEPDYDSIQALRFQGMVGFSVEPDPDGEEPEDVIYTHSYERGDYLVFHGDEERIHKTMATDLKPSDGQDASGLGAVMRVEDPRVLATYLERCEACRKRHVGPCSPAKA